MNRLPSVALAVLLVNTSVVGAVGCSAQCESVRSDYKQALETPLVTGQRSADDTQTDGESPHLGVAISSRRIDQLLDTVIRESIRGATTFVDSIDLGGKQPVEINTDPGIADLSIKPAGDACDTCYRISAALDGRAGVTIPVLGERGTNLSGSVEFVAPIILRSAGNSKNSSKAKIMLDLPAAASHGGFGIDAALGELPASWSSSLTSPLVDVMRQELSNKLKPIEIARFQAPSIEAAGVEFRPTQLRPIGDDEGFFIGVRSNVDSAPTVSADHMVSSLRSGSSDANVRDLAVALPVNFIAHAVVRGFQNGKISRSYDADGRAVERSATKVTMRGVDLKTAASNADTNGVDLNMGFQLWNIPQNGACFSVDGRAATRLKVDGSKLSVGVRDVAFSGNPATRLGLNVRGWRDAEFLQTGATVLSTSLSTDSFRVGPANMSIGSLGLRTAGGSVIVSADLPVPSS